ncbi:hypothetical protein DWB77_04093 [Streptomyces hundungensis]|uniref:Lipoprotein n=1 Tax=Streptomyces hundungensis TaxID=1077946 RepID=A0A387HDJ1_9ACTN|nr:hypothetical protein [Streptomyces hundungensis]AYG81926.1 hypothetical protein DWB77_04093 [Streptomyces hundungensis]
MALHARTAAAVAGLTMIAAAAVSCSGSQPHSGSASTPPAAAYSHFTAHSGNRQNNSTPAPTETNPPGDIPDNQAYVPYQPASGTFTGFTLKVPEGWARTVGHDTTQFTDKLNTVQITATSASAAPTVASVTSTVVPQLHNQMPKFASPKVSEVDRHAGRVVLLTYQADSAKNPVTGKVARDAFERYAYYRAGHEVDVTLSGPVNADNVDPWRTISDSFAWR